MQKLQLRGLRAALVALGLTIAVGAGAQPPGGQGGMAERQRQMQAMMFEGITLTDAQKKSIDSVQAAFREKMQAGTEDRRTLMTQQRDAVRGLLTDEQKKTYDANMEKMRANRQRPNGR